MTELTAGMDFRLRPYREEVWQRFYTFHLQYGTHPGLVYVFLPELAEHYGWDHEEALWFAFLNGNTQHPVTSLLLHRAGPVPEQADRVLAFWRDNYERLAWDTDRRHHKAHLDVAVTSYLSLMGGRTQLRYWSAHARPWAEAWRSATSIATFGRLSAWSYLEYLRIYGIPVEPDTLMLDDRAGSRSHRNGLAILLGADELDWHESNPRFDGHYTPEVIAHFTSEAERILGDARARNAGRPWERDVNYLTMESALCTYKSWHRPRRRYPNVYADMAYDRLTAAEAAWPELDCDPFWRARALRLPDYLRLECNPWDPGLSPAKADHYRLTGEVVMMEHEWPCFANAFAECVAEHAFGRRRR